MKSDAVLKQDCSCVCRKGFSVFIYYAIKTLILATTIILSIVIDNPTQIRLALFYLLALNVLLVFINRKCIYTLIVSLFLLWFNYSIFFANYIYRVDVFFTSWAYSEAAVAGYKIILTFTTVLCVFVKSDSLVVNEENREDEKPHLLNDDQPGYAVFGYCYLLLLLLLLIFGFSRPSVSGERGSPSTFYEYSTIVFIVGFYFFKWDKVYKCFSSILLAMFALQNMFYGGRVTALQLLLLLFIVVYDGKKIPWSRLLPLFIVIFAAFSLIGTMRANARFTLANLVQSFLKSVQGGYVLDTAYSAYYTSLTFVEVEKFVDVKQRLIMFGSFSLSMFLGGSIVKNSNLAIFTQQYYKHYNGGVLPFFGQFYLGGVGVFLTGLLVSFYMNKMKHANSKTDGLIRCALIYITISTPRWYLYSPSSLVRGVFLLAVVYSITLLIIRHIETRKMS